MKKQRIAASVMAAIMTFSAFSSNVIAGDAISADESVSLEEAVLSGSAVAETADAADDEETVEEAADVVAFADGFVSGGMGKVGKNYKAIETDDGVDLRISAQNVGKLSDNEDSYAYYSHPFDTDKDFTLSAKITVNNFNTSFAEGTNQQQSSFGIVAYDEVYTTGSTSNQLFLMAYVPKSSSATGRMVVASRAKGEGFKTIVRDNMSEDFNKASKNLTFDVKVAKAGANYVFTCNGTDGTADGSQIFTGTSANIGFFVARDADISVSDLEFKMDEKSVSSIKVLTPPEKVVYGIDESLDVTGLTAEVTYSDGSTGVLDASDLVVSGFDSSTSGTKTMYISKGFVSEPFEYSVVSNGIVSVDILTTPYIDEYTVDMLFDPSGTSAQATLNTGEVVDLIYIKDYDEAKADATEQKTPKYTFYLDGEEIDAEYAMKEKNVGNKKVEVRAVSSSSVEANDVSATFDITVKDNKLTEIEVLSKPINLDYYMGQTFDPSGILVNGVFTNASGNKVTCLLDPSEYTLEVPAFDEPGVKQVKVVSNQKPEISTTFDFNLYSKNFIEYRVKEYPVMTIQVGEEFDPSGLEVGPYYTSGEIEATDKYTLDYSQFDNSKPGKTTVNININAENGPAVIPLEITVREKTEQKWQTVVFGQSTSLNANKAYENADGTVKVSATAGKITADHDGIAYYFTRLNANDNFTLNATITVDQYLSGNDDTKRNGQEAFGIMIRDAVPYAAADGGRIPVTTKKEAKLDENGEPIVTNSAGKVFASDMAILGGYSGTSWPTNPNAVSYVKNSTINRINLVGRYGTREHTLGGLADIDGPYKLSDTFPTIGYKYDLTMKKSGDGIYAKCYDYQTGETKETYQYFGDDFVSHLDPDYQFIGFFAARSAEFTVNSYDLHVTDPETDIQEYQVTEAAKTPAISLESSRFTTNDEYQLLLKATNQYGGTVKIIQNGKVVYRDSPVSRKNTNFPIDMVKNTINQFTVIYTPNSGDNITSSDSSVITFDVTHKDSEVSGDIIYAGPDGVPEAAGTKDDPLDFQSALGFVQPGQTVICLEGVYKVRSSIDIPVTKYGFRSSPITVKSEDGKRAVIDLQKTYEGISVRPEWWRIKGLDIINSADNQKPFHLAGNNCIIEDCKFHDNGDTGFQISRLGSDSKLIEDWPSNNLILNCESYNNADPAGINADGFGCKLTVGTGNIFEGCVSHHNIDDGWDCYTKLGSGPIGAATLENCISYKQGYYLNEDGTERFFNAGGNNGYKMGGENLHVKHYLKDCLAFYNNGNGITSNSNPQMKIRNFVSYRNGGAGITMYSENNPMRYDYDLAGVISYDSGKDTIGTVTRDEDWSNAAPIPVTSSNNYLNWGNGSYNTKYVEFDQTVLEGIEAIRTKLEKDNVKIDEENAEIEAKNERIKAGLEEGTVQVLKERKTESDITSAQLTYAKAQASAIAGNEFVCVSLPGGYYVIDQPVTDDFFVSLKSDVSLVKGRYPQDEDGNFIRGDFLKLVSPYVVTDEADLVEYSTFGSTEATTSDGSTESTTETETKSSRSGGGGGGGGSSSSSSKSGTSSSLATTTESATEETTEKATSVYRETTTEATTSSSDLFNDISNKPWAVDAINNLAELGIIRGVGENKFAPDSSCKRADFAIMLVNVLGIDGTASDNFDDVAENKYYYNYVGLAKEAGIVNGYGDGTFGPENLCTRAELMVMVANALSVSGLDITADEAVLDRFSDADDIPVWARPYVAALVELGVVNGSDGKINANVDITRAEVAVIMYNILDIATVDESVDEEPEDEDIAEEPEETEDETEEAEETEAVDEAETAEVE